MAKKNSVYKKGENGSFDFWGYLPTEDVVSATQYSTDIGGINGNISSLSTRLTTAEGNISDRYTKGESDGKYLPIDGTAKYANVLKNAPGQYGVDGMNRLSSWDEINAPSWHGIRAQLITTSLQGKTEPDGTIMTFGWDTSYYDTQLLIPGGDSAGKVYNVMLRTQSGTSTYGSWHYIPYMEDVDKKIANEITKEALTSVLGFGGYQPTITWGSMTSGYTPVWGADNLHGGGIHFAEKDGHTSMQIDGTFRQREGDYEVIDTSTIGSQHVSEADHASVADTFTATEVDHGCKFNGDLSSTTLVSSPLHMAVSEFNTSEANSPTAPRTLTGNIEVTFGSAKKTIANMKYNPFMAYFFDHGYHFSAVKEGGDSTLYDKGIVTYGQFIYYCVYAYHSDGSDSFDAAIIMTDDTKEMSKYVMYESGKAKDLMIEGNYIKTDGLKRVNIQEKAGTLALLSDIPSVPSVINNLASTSSSSALSAYQGKVLDGKISAIKFSQLAVGSSIGSIGSSNARGDEDLTYSAHLYGGTYGRFYVISGLENGYNSDYGKLVVKTSSTGKADMTTNMVAGVSGETGYWRPQWLSVSVFVPAGKDYYLWGCRITNVYCSCAELSH